jgi:hypothetical protein
MKRRRLISLRPPTLTKCSSYTAAGAPTAPKLAGTREDNPNVAGQLKPVPSPSPSPACTRRGAPTLQVLSIVVLANHLEELIESGHDIIPYLPVAVKATLMAVAHRHGLLNDTSLRLFADAEHSILDLSSRCGVPHVSVSQSGLLFVAKAMPNLRFVDLTGLRLSCRMLRALVDRCPLIEVMRFGGFEANYDALGEALVGTLPQLRRASDVPAAASWDELEDEGRAVVDSKGRLMKLRCVAWPEMPEEVRLECKNAAPAICINPTEAEAKMRRFPPPKLPLYWDAVDDVAAAAPTLLRLRNGQDAARTSYQGEEQQQPVVHIAEKFRAAYVDRARRLRAAEERRRKREARRYQQSLGGGAKAIRDWELEM